MKKDIVLQKGESIQFLDFTIWNSLNNDGLVLLSKAGTHLGNFGAGEQDDVDNAKMAAILYFMIARPDKFGVTLIQRLMGRGGQHLEYSLFREVVLKEGLEMPEEITTGGYFEDQVKFKGMKINKWVKS